MINLFYVKPIGGDGTLFDGAHVIAETAEEAVAIYNQDGLKVHSKRELIQFRKDCMFMTWPSAHDLAEKGCIEFDLTKQQVFPFNPDWIQE